MEGDQRITGIFFAGIVVSSFVISPDVLDLTLVARFISLSLFLFLTFAVLIRQAPQMTVKADLLTSAYALYAVFCCSSILWAHAPTEALFESSKILMGFFTFLLAVFALTRNEDAWLNRFLKFSVLLFFLELVFVVIQCTDLGDLDKDSLYIITGMNGHKNLLSSFLLLNLFFLIKAWYRLQKPWKLLAGIAIVLSLVLIGILQTKAVWLGLMVALLSYAAAYVFLVARPKVKWKLNVYVLIGIAVLLSNLFFLKVLPTIVDKGRSYNKEVQIEGVNTARRELDDERLMLWQKTYAVFHEKPLLGTGMGNWQIWYPKAGLKHLWRAEELNYTFQRPHNDWLWILSETGIIGFNLFLVFLISILAFLLKAAIAVAHDRPSRRRLTGCIAIITGYFTAAFFDFPRERMEHTIWINLIFALAYVEIRNLIPLRSFFSFTPRRLHYVALAALTGFIVYVGVLRHQGEFTLRKMYAYKVRGKLDQVIDLCKAAGSFAYTIDPTSMPICWYSGNAKAQNKDFAGAHEDLLKAYRLNPCNRNVLNDLASSYAFRNEIEQAKKYYKEAARISPRFDDAKLNLAAIYIREENYKMALYWLHSLDHDSERRTAYETIVKGNLR